MPIFRTVSLTSALALYASGAVALTPEQVWQDFSELLTSGGAEIATEAETRESDTLRVEGIVVTAPIGESGDTAEMTIPELSFTNRGDGSVAITFPPEITSNMTTRIDGDMTSFDLALTHDAFEMIVSGDDSVERYAFSGDRMNVRTPAPMRIEEEDSGVFVMEIDLTMEGIDGAYDVSGSNDLRQYDTRTTYETISYDIGGLTIPETEGDPEESFKIEGTVTGVESSGAVALPSFETGVPLGAMIADGFGFSTDLTFDEGGYAFTSDNTDGTAFVYETKNQNGQLSVSLGQDGIAYSGSGSDVIMTLSGNTIPIPQVALTLAQNAFDFRAPLVPADEPQEFGLLLSMVDLVVPNELWDLFDPQGALPRDPATVVLDIDGTATLAQDITDPALAESGTAPGELNSVDITDLQISLAGADLSGDGAFTFTTGPSGVPTPSGTATVMLTGGNALLDALVQMGLLPQEQAMGARMMIGLFARPGQGEDSLVSEIEVKEDGSVLANGQRIR